MNARWVRFILGMLIMALSANGDNISGWRTKENVYPDSRATLTWSPIENIIWKTKLDQDSNASPIITKNKIFICSEPDSLLCVERDSGEISWKRSHSYLDALDEHERSQALELRKQGGQWNDQIGNNEKEIRQLERALRKKQTLSENQIRTITDQVKALSKEIEKLKAKIQSVALFRLPYSHAVTGYTSPTPVTDGRYVCTVTGAGVAVCYDLDGNRKWIQILARPDQQFGHCISPILHGQKVVVHIKNMLSAYNLPDGKMIWQTPSPSTWGSPVHTSLDGQSLIVTALGDVCRLEDGKKMLTAIGSSAYCTPAVSDDRIYFVDTDNKSKAIKLVFGNGGTLTSETKWSKIISRERIFASPVVVRGVLYVVTQNNILSATEASTGELLYKTRLPLGPGTVYPSLIAANGNILVSSDNGTTIVLKAGPDFVMLNKNSLEEFRSTPLIQSKRMFIRGRRHLYCIGER